MALPRVTAGAADLLADPQIDAVVTARPTRFHSAPLVQGRRGRETSLCQKPGGQSLDDLNAAPGVVEAAGVHFQIGFNRRYAEDFHAAKKDLAAGIAGQPQLLRSLTRDPARAALSMPESRPGPSSWKPRSTPAMPWACQRRVRTGRGLRSGGCARGTGPARPGILGHCRGHHPIQQRRPGHGEASFSALYGYDVRGEVFGSKGTVQAGRITETAAR